MPQPPSQAQLLIEPAVKQMRALQAQGRYQEALDICLDITRNHPERPNGWSDAAINCVRLYRWEEAISHGQAALARGGAGNTALHDALAHAYGKLGQWDEARRHGLESLNMRARYFSGEAVIPLPEPGPMPPPPSAQTRARNISAFSLFGGDSKYCEPAVLNVQEQPHIYPHWVCRFYVDDSVPDKVIARLAKSGAQIVPVDGPAAQWPGPMWRFLALNDPLAHRMLFRDADSVISRREAAAVAQWVSSGQRFHMMRDAGSHTELMMAGLWGAVAGSLPPLDTLMQRFMSAPLESRHFADQFFLRQYVWPYARASLIQHDSVFGFMGGVPFPDGARLQGFCVGDAEGGTLLAAETNKPDGSEITWEVQRIEQLSDGQTRSALICSYTSTAQNGLVKVHIPRRYVQWMQQGTARLNFVNRNITV
jgi:hypothetical protein